MLVAWLVHLMTLDTVCISILLMLFSWLQVLGCAEKPDQLCFYIAWGRVSGWGFGPCMVLREQLTPLYWWPLLYLSSGCSRPRGFPIVLNPCVSIQQSWPCVWVRAHIRISLTISESPSGKQLILLCAMANCIHLVHNGHLRWNTQKLQWTRPRSCFVISWESVKCQPCAKSWAQTLLEWTPFLSTTQQLGKVPFIVSFHTKLKVHTFYSTLFAQAGLAATEVAIYVIENSMSAKVMGT